ncbi:hypothetical protein PR202_gb00222 [Eleusine coracana subsp. coracana]|uniref:Uncharacterized protein n=1 Tax=Eleusine coracana subsp. coracana TaxID=191504 RepID=A0AAV5DUB5_ELECO|nr:hypothetical protein PR202_gb00222 [Eleusine coracana subsp. coracana]
MDVGHGGPIALLLVPAHDGEKAALALASAFVLEWWPEHHREGGEGVGAVDAATGQHVSSVPGALWVLSVNSGHMFVARLGKMSTSPKERTMEKCIAPSRPQLSTIRAQCSTPSKRTRTVGRQLSVAGIQSFTLIVNLS